MSAPLKVDQHLTIPAARLAHAAPQAWDEFRTAFKKYADAMKDQMVSAPPDQLQKAQGRAQECSTLTALLDDAVAAANRASAPAGSKPKP